MRVSTAFTLLAAFAAAGCAKSSPSGPTTNDNNNNTGNNTPTTVDITTRVNELLAEMNSSEGAISQGGGAADRLVAGGIQFSLAPRPLANPSGPSFTTSVPNDSAAACTFDATSSKFNCLARTLPGSGFIHIVSFQFVDSAGKPQTQFDTIKTAGLIRWTADSGTRSQPVQTMSGPVPATQSTHNSDSTMLTGLHVGQTHTQNGAGTLQQMIAEQGVVDTAFITAPTTVTGIQTGATVPYPVAGSYTAVVHTVQGATNSTTTQVTSFNGTSTATLVITFLGGAKRTCTYNMTSQVAPTCTGP
jgi:hypothetical protein